MATEKNLYNASTHSSVEVTPTTLKWANKDKKTPKEIYNWKLYYLIFIFSLIGVGRIYDEANIYGSIAQKSFLMRFFVKKTLPEIKHIVSNLAPCVQFGSIGGAIVAAFTVDKIGRVRALQGTCLVWIAGVAIQITSKKIGQLYAGRLIEGLAIGFTTTVGPIFISEISPPAHRGAFMGCFAASGFFGYFISYAANYGTAKHLKLLSKNTWIIPTAIKIVFPGLAFLGSFLCFESPRWLFMKGDVTKATENLCKLRNLPENHPYVLSEISDIQDTLITEKEINYTIGKKFKVLVLNHSISYRFWIVAVTILGLGQASGPRAIQLYTPAVFANIGILGVYQLRMMMYLGLAFFLLAVLAIYLIDVIGRRKSLFIGIGMQAVGNLIFGIFLNVVRKAVIPGAPLTQSQVHAGRFSIVGGFLIIMGWSVGFNATQFLYATEIFPYGMRTFALSLVLALIYLGEYSCLRIIEKMQEPLNHFGIFYFFLGVCVLTLTWAYLFAPDTTGRSLDSMEEVFHVGFFQIGRKGVVLCPDNSEVARYGKKHSVVQGKDSGLQNAGLEIKDELDHVEEVA